MNKSMFLNFQEFQKIIVICPICGDFHRLSELKLFYKGKAERSWLDDLRDKERRIERLEEKLEAEREEIKERAQEKARRKLPKLLKKKVPLIAKKGYFPQDVKALFDPIDFVVFDGMNEKDNVRRVVFLDGPAQNRIRERVQISIKKIIKAGNFEWRTIKISEDGEIENKIEK